MVERLCLRLVSLGMALLFASACASTPPRGTLELSPETPRITLMTFNVNFGLAGNVETVDAIARNDADVVMLQETTPAWERELRSQLGAAYPHMRFVQARGAGGLGVLSKYPIAQFEPLPPVDWFPAARVVVDSPLGRLQVLNVHLRPPLSNTGNPVSGYLSTPPVREAEMRAFTAALDPDLPTLIVGDFNESEDGGAFKFLAEKGFRSALSEFSPNAKTWNWPTSVITLRGRYDHLCYDRRLTPADVEVIPEGRSDHLPVLGTFVLSRITE
jgi:endonuclease/exonuclease/phosphatase (EEP) superfamily protein YafD